MDHSRAQRKSNEEWLELITECRTSSLSDREWCRRNDIAVSRFYNAVCQLKKAACQIPESHSRSSLIDLTANSQEVVPITIIPDQVPETHSPQTASSDITMNLKNQYNLQISCSGMEIYIGTHASTKQIETVLTTLRRQIC